MVLHVSKWGDFEIDPNTGMLVLPEGLEVETEIKYDMVVCADLFKYEPRKRTWLGKKLIPRHILKDKRVRVSYAVLSVDVEDTLRASVLTAVAKAITDYHAQGRKKYLEEKRRESVENVLGVFKNSPQTTK